jgi:protein phosphatase
MPWSAKAQELLRRQYAAVGASSNAALPEAVSMLEQAAMRGVDVGSTLSNYKERSHMAVQYVDSYRRYCWQVDSVNDLKLAPFHILATEGSVHIDKNHVWHMDTIAKICQSDAALLQATAYKVVSRKRSLALREFALGIEALERFVKKEPLRRVHECVFGVLALESEPVDPRL